MVNASASSQRRAFSMVGMLVTMLCIVVLFAIMMQSLNKAVTGQGSQHEGTVRSFQDDMYLSELYKGIAVAANDNRGQYLTPSIVSGSKNVGENTTAN